MNILKGNLTYLVAGLTFVWAVVGFLLGQLDAQSAGTLVLAAMGTFGIRRALP